MEVINPDIRFKYVLLITHELKPVRFSQVNNLQTKKV